MAQIHIVLATYNGEKYLREQLDSLLAQTYSDFDIEICDDGSTDSTIDIVNEYMEKDSRISLHRNEENLGYVKNFLYGVRRSKSSYIMLCDQDDIWNPDKISVTLEAMQKAEKENPDVPLLVFTDAMNYDSDSGLETGRFQESSHLNIKKVDSAHLFMENKCIGCTVMVNQKILPYLDEIPDGIRVHDWWLALICSHFGNVVYLDRPTLRYRQHSGNMIGGGSFSDYIKSRLTSVSEQRKALKQTYRQGEAFYSVFRDRMNDKQRKTAECFAAMEQAGWFLRRANMIRYGFTKSGWLRNIGLFFLI